MNTLRKYPPCSLAARQRGSQWKIKSNPVLRTITTRSIPPTCTRLLGQPPNFWQLQHVKRRRVARNNNLERILALTHSPSPHLFGDLSSHLLTELPCEALTLI